MNEAYFHLPIEKQERILNAGIREFGNHPYTEANTDSITHACEISKGLLFHYFGSKKDYYLFCLDQALKRLTTICTTKDSTMENKNLTSVEHFYNIVMKTLDEKIEVCLKFTDEMHMVNMASRDMNSTIADQKNHLLLNYTLETKRQSKDIFRKALEELPLIRPVTSEVVNALVLYTGAVINQYLIAYQNNPDAFFLQIESVKKEITLYLDFMLYGICKAD